MGHLGCPFFGAVSVPEKKYIFPEKNLTQNFMEICTFHRTLLKGLIGKMVRGWTMPY